MKLLLTGAFNYTEEQLNKIKKMNYDITFIQDEREKILFDVSKFEVVVCNNLFLYNDIKKFKNLKVIQLTSSGIDRVPINYINKNGIKLYNAKNIYSVPMAEWTILKILEIYKKSSFFYKNQTENYWEKQKNLLELTNKKVGIIGFGSVGLEIAKRLKSFNTSNIAINRSEIESEYIDSYIPLNKLNNVLPDLDIIIITIAFTSETKHLISQKELKKMKNDSVLLNISRGEIINEDDLIMVLNQDKFLGVALDVFEKEPLPSDSILWEFDNVLITPHNSFASEINNERLFNFIYKNLINIGVNTNENCDVKA